MTISEAREVALHGNRRVIPAVPPTIANHGTAPPQTPAFEVDLLEILRGIWRQRVVVVGFGVLGCMVGLGAALLHTPTYTSETRLMLESRRNEVLDNSILPGLSLTDELIETEIELVASRTIKQRVVERTSLTDLLQRRADEQVDWSVAHRVHSMFAYFASTYREELSEWFPSDWVDVLAATPTPEPLDTEAAVHFLNERLSARQIGNTSVMSVAVTDRDADLAALLSNTVAQAYLDDQLGWKITETSDANVYLDGRIASLQSTLDEKRRRLESLRNNTGQIDGTTATLLAQRQVASTERLHDARAQQTRLESELASLEGLVVTQKLSDLAVIIATPVMDNLRIQDTTARQSLAELLTTLGERHPRIVDARNRIAEIESNIRVEVQRHINGLRTELAASRREVELLKADLEAQDVEDQSMDDDRGAVAALEREIETTQTLLDEYLSRFMEAGDQAAIIRPDARVISEAIPNPFSNFPNRKIILVGVAAFMTLIGVIFAFFRDAADKTLRSIESAEKALRIPIVGLVPQLPPRDRKRPLINYVHLNPTSAVNESIRNVATSLGLSPQIGRGQVLLVTSAVPGEGKSSVAAVIAQQVASAGHRSVILETDLRRPSLAKMLGCRSDVGLVQMLHGDCAVEEAIQRSSYGMNFVAAGQVHENSLYLLQSDEMRQLVDWLRQSHELVILDSPPLLALPDAQVLAELADAVLYLCKWGSTPAGSSSTGLRMLVRNNGAVVMGALSQVDMKRYASYDHAYSDYSINNYYHG